LHHRSNGYCRFTPGALPGRTMARIGLRMMPPFPSSSLSFRTAGFPQYGWKAGISDGACPFDYEFFASCGLHPPFVPFAAYNLSSF
jgi:hypothetical protein